VGDDGFLALEDVERAFFGELTAVLESHPGEIGGRHFEGWGGWAVAFAVHAVAGAAILAVKIFAVYRGGSAGGDSLDGRGGRLAKTAWQQKKNKTTRSY